MGKKDFFKDLERLLKDLETSDHSTVVRSEERRLGDKKKGPVLRTDYSIRGQVGIPQPGRDRKPKPDE
ncbi:MULTISPECIES: hypothetical protein [Alteribacter]|uniref:Uncharacterized protein n=1 Tax=Alteribacter keqinensis TaxID=2483800 RepID=A0A3M7TQ39_9BACI|nr:MULTISPECIES: hypothetical protein [Alteribacter]MBM7095656.1 hypothetical protein [Alteribacter salitolerans]RNA67756.1 hypothetical protein EBO34_13670 [Alteribacter keqinensis]